MKRFSVIISLLLGVCIHSKACLWIDTHNYYLFNVCDKEEFAWYINSNLNLHSGWNQIDLKLAGAGVTGGSPDLTRMNFIRIYHLGVRSDVTLKIDDIKFVQE